MQRTAKLTITATILAVIALSLGACSSGGSSDSKDSTVAATVNGKTITSAQVERVINQQAQGKQSQFSAHDLAQARLQVLDKLIQREVLYQRAEQEKLLPTEEQVTSAINQQKQQSGVTQEEFDRQLKQQNMTAETLREEAKKDLAINSLLDKYAGKITISDREVEEYYSTNKEQFVNARGVALAMIAVDPADNSQQGFTQGDAKSEAEAKTKIDGIYLQLKSGADFAEVARARSEDPSLLRGGDIGSATEEDLKGNGFPSEVISQLFGPMELGSFTSPVKFSSQQYPNGRWYVFKLKEKRLQTENLLLEGQFPNGESVRHRITVVLTDQRKDILNAALLEVAMSETKIVNHLAAGMLNNPSNLGLRPAATGAATSSPVSATSTTSQTTAPSTAPSATVSPAAASGPKASASKKP